MNNEIFHYIVIISISGVLSILLGVYAYVRRRDFSSSQIFIWISALSALYIFGHALELASSSLSEIKFWIKVQYLGLPFISPMGLILIMHYVGLEKYIHRKSIGLILLIPFSTLLLSLSNDLHHLMYRSVYLRPNEDHPLADMIAGPWYIIHGSYTFAALLLGICLLLWYWIRTKWVYWKQIVTLLMGNLLPMLASFLYLIGVSPMGMDPVPIVMCFTSALYFWAILSSNLFVLAPIARERVFESMRDGVLVVDTENRIVDYNAAARSMIAALDASSIGKSITDFLDDTYQSQIAPTSDHLIEIELDWMNQEGKQFRICSTPLVKGKGVLAGRTIVLNDITEQKQLEEKLTQLAFTDGLTKIYNRIYFMDKSSKLLEDSRDRKRPFTLFLFDIDFFKKINDTYGHSVGDQAICHLVSICKGLLEPNHVLARFGGEEFIVSLPDLSMEAAGRLAEQIRSAIESSPLQCEAGQIGITASFGVAQAMDSSTLDTIIHQADQALYAAKNGGRNAVHLAAELVSN